ncbi:MAG: DUF5615 family PIN-like protein [bacterium]
MKFFLDENFPKSVGRFLERSGHEVFDIRSTEDEGSDDRKIFELAQAEAAIFLTTDRDFFHTIPHLHKKHFGVIVIALKQPNRSQIQEKIEWILHNFELAEFKNHVLLFRDQHFTRLPKE